VENKVKLTLELAPEVNEILERLASLMHSTKSDVLRKGIALMEIAAEAKKEGQNLGVATSGQPLAKEIIGLF
jgi:predicted transcriptional regulator